MIGSDIMRYTMVVVSEVCGTVSGTDCVKDGDCIKEMCDNGYISQCDSVNKCFCPRRMFF